MSSQQKVKPSQVKPSQVKPGKIFGNVKPSQVKPEKFAGLPRPGSGCQMSEICEQFKVAFINHMKFLPKIMSNKFGQPTLQKIEHNTVV